MDFQKLGYILLYIVLIILLQTIICEAHRMSVIDVVCGDIHSCRSLCDTPSDAHKILYREDLHRRIEVV
ncbi:hypothetical protein BJX62DRAFT_220012 [Aspergillus germanicus]